MRLDGSTLLALKKDMDRPNRLVAVDLATGRERRIAWTGSVNTPPVLGDSVIYWSEYRSSTLWEQRVFSVACRYDLRTGRRKTLRKRGNALYPTPLPGGQGWLRSVTTIRGSTCSTEETGGDSLFPARCRYTVSLTTA